MGAWRVVRRVATGLDPDVERAVDDRADLISSWWTFAVLVLLGVLLVVVAVRRRRSRTRAAADGGPARRRRAWPFAVAGVVVLVVGLAVGANAFSGYIPSVHGLAVQLGYADDATGGPTATVRPSADATVVGVPRPLPSGAGTVSQVTIDAPADLDVPPSTTYVYTPPGYDGSGHVLYPFVMLFHGSPGDSADWFGAGLASTLDALITSGQLRPTVVVTPDYNGVGTDDTGCLDSTQGGSKVETYLQDVVVPWVDEHYAVSDDWRYRAIGGMSAGAYCALDQGLRHLDSGTIIAIMPYDDPGSSATDQLGRDGDALAHTPSHYVPTMTFPHPVGVFFADGDEEQVQDVIRSRATLTSELQARGQVVASQIVPGGHDWNTAAEAIPYGLQFFEQRMDAYAGMPPSPTVTPKKETP